MAFLRSVAGLESGPVLQGVGVALRPPIASDYVPWAELRAHSRDYLVPWEPSWSSDELTRAAYRRRLRHYQKDQRDETGYAFFVFREGDGALMGGLSLSNVRRGVTQSASLGYWLGLPYAGRGHMTAAVTALVPFVFGALALHRLEAACVPSNAASIRVMEKCGFEREGYARSYLKINGRWQDHYLFAMISDRRRR
jgi:[ribosomal protein S5]-alanine N-acetyltransferase